MGSEEQYDVLNRRGEKTGVAKSKSEVHERGLWHGAMNLCITDGRGNIYIQRRGGLPHVNIFPNKWDIYAAAGHMSAGSTVLDTVCQEMGEEIGQKFTPDELKDHQLTKVAVAVGEYWVPDSRFVSGGFQHRVFDHLYVVCMELDIPSLVLEANKVVAVELVPIGQVRADILNAKSPTRSFAQRPPNSNANYLKVLRAAEWLKAR